MGAGVSVEFCFTLSAQSMNRFCLTGFIVAPAIRELLSASAVIVFTIMICAYGCVSCSPTQSHVCLRLLSVICRHKRCRPVWAQCCNTIDSSLLTRARQSPGTIIGSGEDYGFQPKHPDTNRNTNKTIPTYSLSRTPLTVKQLRSKCLNII